VETEMLTMETEKKKENLRINVTLLPGRPLTEQFIKSMEATRGMKNIKDHL
jgi:hypothetical protein